MKKVIKILVILIVLALLVVAGAVIYVGTHLGGLAKVAIENVAPKITQTSVTLDSVDVSLFTGSAGVNGLVVGNPANYQTPSAISIGKAAVSVVPGSLFSDKIVVKSVEVRDPEITFEGNPLGNNNLSQILDNVKSASGTNTTTASSPSASSQPGKKLEVDDFLLTGAKIHANITGLNSVAGLVGATNTSFTIPIPDIHLTNLGTGSDGITASELTKELLEQINTAAIKAVADYAKTNLTGAANGLINGVKSNAGKAITNGANEIKKGLNGLFGK